MVRHLAGRARRALAGRRANDSRTAAGGRRPHTIRVPAALRGAGLWAARLAGLWSGGRLPALPAAHAVARLAQIPAYAGALERRSRVGQRVRCEERIGPR